MYAHAGVPRWLWKLATCGLAALLAGVAGLAAALSLGLADPPRAGPLLWQDDFKAGAERWQFGGSPGARAAPARGALQVEFSGPEQMAWGLTDRPAGDFTLEVAATQTAGEPGAAYGLVFDWQDKTHYAAVLVNGNGYAQAFRQAGAERQEWFAWQQWPHLLVPPESNRVRLDLRGSAAVVRVNDEVLVRGVDAGGAPGRLGVLARGFGEGRVVFSWVRVWAAGP